MLHMKISEARMPIDHMAIGQKIELSAPESKAGAELCS